jgi:hypothetical protein
LSVAGRRRIISGDPEKLGKAIVQLAEVEAHKALSVTTDGNF